MTTLKAKKLNAALAKAKKVGRAELPITLDGCSLVLQNLSTSDYESITDELEGLDEVAYAHAYQIGHICRSIVEIDGVDLRDVKYIEDDVPTSSYTITGVFKSAAKAQEAKRILAEAKIDVTVTEPSDEEGQPTRVVNIERHEWVKQKISSWGREAVFIAMKKFAEVLIAGQNKAQDGVVFTLNEESYADRFRRLLLEAKALEAELPPDMVSSILMDSGYLQKTSQEELEAAQKRMRDFQEEQQAMEEEAEPEPLASRPAPSPPPRQPEPEPTMEDADLQASLQQMMQRRQPLNRTAIAAPTPVQPPIQTVQPTSSVPPQLATAARTRSDAIAQLESQLDPDIMSEVHAAQGSEQVRELSRPMEKPDGSQILSILNQPPTAGINPRFKPRKP